MPLTLSDGVRIDDVGEMHCVHLPLLDSLLHVGFGTIPISEIKNFVNESRRLCFINKKKV